MDELVIMHDQQAVTTSLLVAETLGKQHKHVLDAIQGLLSTAENSALLETYFVEGTYKASNGKENPMYYMNRDGFTILAMGFTGSKALQFKLQYIDAFNKMERAIQYGGFMIPDNLPDALRLAADQADQIEKMKPKVDYFDKQMHNPGLMTTTVIAKQYGWSATRLNRKLNELHVIFRQGKNWVPTQKYADKGYCGYENFANEENQHVHPLLKLTQRGQKFIHDLLAEEGILIQAETMQLVSKED